MKKITLIISLFLYNNVLYVGLWKKLEQLYRPFSYACTPNNFKFSTRIDYYKVAIENARLALGLPKNYTKEQIEKNFQKLAKQFHPDLQVFENKSYYEEKMKEINNARDYFNRILKNRNPKRYFFVFTSQPIQTYS